MPLGSWMRGAAAASWSWAPVLGPLPPLCWLPKGLLSLSSRHAASFCDGWEASTHPSQSLGVREVAPPLEVREAPLLGGDRHRRDLLGRPERGRGHVLRDADAGRLQPREERRAEVARAAPLADEAKGAVQHGRLEEGPPDRRGGALPLQAQGVVHQGDGALQLAGAKAARDESLVGARGGLATAARQSVERLQGQAQAAVAQAGVDERAVGGRVHLDVVLARHLLEGLQGLVQHALAAEVAHEHDERGVRGPHAELLHVGQDALHQRVRAPARAAVEDRVEEGAVRREAAPAHVAEVLEALLDVPHGAEALDHRGERREVGSQATGEKVVVDGLGLVHVEAPGAGAQERVEGPQVRGAPGRPDRRHAPLGRGQVLPLRQPAREAEEGRLAALGRRRKPEVAVSGLRALHEAQGRLEVAAPDAGLEGRGVELGGGGLGAAGLGAVLPPEVAGEVRAVLAAMGARQVHGVGGPAGHAGGVQAAARAGEPGGAADLGARGQGGLGEVLAVGSEGHLEGVLGIGRGGRRVPHRGGEDEARGLAQGGVGLGCLQGLPARGQVVPGGAVADLGLGGRDVHGRRVGVVVAVDEAALGVVGLEAEAVDDVEEEVHVDVGWGLTGAVRAHRRGRRRRRGGARRRGRGGRVDVLDLLLIRQGAGDSAIVLRAGRTG
mmetsp:Transcript_39654/g.86413  ORF Transcript_39654/g.86413 Transcript_39654/m.86413 type:complete len:667 (+) Transcript_39654:81-2081(+)